MKDTIPTPKKLCDLPLQRYCPADPRLGYFTFGIHEKEAKQALKLFSQDDCVERIEYVEGNIRIYYKETTNA